jgi:hypothetical protein
LTDLAAHGGRHGNIIKNVVDAQEATR